MDSEQYRTLILEMNKDRDGDGVSDMLQEMNDKMLSKKWDRYQNAEGGPQLGNQLDMLEAVKQKYIEKANQELIDIYPQLQTAIDNIDATIERTGSK